MTTEPKTPPQAETPAPAKTTREKVRGAMLANLRNQDDAAELRAALPKRGPR